MNETVIIDGVRTPIGRMRGGLSRVRSDDLAAHTLKELLRNHPRSTAALGEVILGATNQAGEDNRNVARMALLLAGLPDEVTGVTVNRLCGSGLEALIQAHRAIAMGDQDVMVAGGVESMTRAPYVMAKSDQAYESGSPKIWDTSLGWRFPNAALAKRFPLTSMGETAENVAERYNISREDQDAFALASHQKAAAAWDAGHFDDEVVPVTVPPASKRAEATNFSRDEGIRANSTLEKLASLKPAFREGGSVTAANSSSLNDGAAMLLCASKAWADERNIKPMGRIVATASAGVDPEYMGIGPIPATRKALDRAGLKARDLDLIELNEAFASQSLACIRELELDAAKVNVSGGAIALGHPIGCSGARIMVTLLHAMKRKNARYGLATLCIGVGQGLAVIVERSS